MRRRTKHEDVVAIRAAGTLAAAIGQHPREFVGIVMATIAIFAIFINALFLQKGVHPAPIFATRPFTQADAPGAGSRLSSAPTTIAPNSTALSRAQLISDIQRELNRRGFYEGGADGVWGAKTDSAARDFIQASGLTINAEPTEGLLRAIRASRARADRAAATQPARDAIAELIAPSKRLQAIQRALAEFGYGQIKPTGLFDAETRTAIEKFERDHHLPVTGEISERFVRELAAMTARSLE